VFLLFLQCFEIFIVNILPTTFIRMTLTCKYSLLSLKKLATWSVHMPPNLWIHVQLQFETPS